jgi:hypothetical protein
MGKVTRPAIHAFVNSLQNHVTQTKCDRFNCTRPEHWNNSVRNRLPKNRQFLQMNDSIAFLRHSQRSPFRQVWTFVPYGSAAVFSGSVCGVIANAVWIT